MTQSQNHDFQSVFDQIYSQIDPTQHIGQVPNYIPELANINPRNFGAYLHHLNQPHAKLGMENTRFSIQSIVKVFVLMLSYREQGEHIFTRVDVEPSGHPFNSLTLLEKEAGIPRNPLINAGALVLCDLLMSMYKDPYAEILLFIQKLAQDKTIHFDHKVAQSEIQNGFRNSALVNLMREFKNIHNPVQEVLEYYFYTCAIAMNCQQLSKAFLPLVNAGIHPSTGETILTLSQTKRINAIMQTCGFYDEAGEFAFRVGLPGKSGVGGGIIALHPGQYTVTVWSPPLNPKGNSTLGMHFLEELTTQTQLSIF